MEQIMNKTLVEEVRGVGVQQVNDEKPEEEIGGGFGIKHIHCRI